MAQRRFLQKRSAYESLLTQQVKVVIVCEGKKTEPKYFESYITHYFRDAKNIKVIPNTRGKTGIEQLYSIACKNQRKYSNASVFIVFDDDGKLSDPAKKQKLIAVLSKCALGTAVSKDKINCIFSSPQFELWAILHFEYTTSALTKKDIERRTANWFPKYDPKNNKEIDFQIILKKTGAEEYAIRNAQKLRRYNAKTAKNDILTCPSTNVDILIKYMNTICVHRPN